MNDLAEATSHRWLFGYDVGAGFTLVRRDENNRRQFFTCEEYPFSFFIRAKDVEAAKPHLRIYRDMGHVGGFATSGPDWARVYVRNISEFRDNNPRNTVVQQLETAGIKTYEADLTNVKRFLIDHVAEIATNHNICYFDIETDDRQGFIDIGNQRIVSIGIIDRNGNRWWFCDDDERKIVKRAVKVFDQYDVVVGYNSDRFDLPVVIGRCKAFGIRPPAKYIVFLDLFKRLARSIFRYSYTGGFESRSWRLDDVAEAIVGEKKIAHTESIWTLFNTNRELLERYNMKDVELLMGIDKGLSALDLMTKQCEITGKFLDANIYVGELLDVYILRAAATDGYHFPSNFRYRKDEKGAKVQIAGGRVADVKPGIYENVSVYDFSAMYPNIIINWNIGPDTIVEHPDPTIHNISPVGCGFVKQPRSIFSKIIVKLLEARKEYKQVAEDAEYGSRAYRNATISQNILKELGNSCYGIFADTDARYFRKEVAESITLTGQWLNKQMNEWYEARGGVIAFSDTDSCAVALPPELDPDTSRFDLMAEYPTMLKKEFNVDGAKFDIKFEKFFARLAVLTKKQYAGKLTNADGKTVNRIFVRGLEYVKRDTIDVCRTAYGELLDLLFKGDDIPAADVVESWFARWRARFFVDEFALDDVAIRKTVKANLDNYKNPPAHVEVAKAMLADGFEFYPGQDVRFVVVETKPKLRAVPLHRPEAANWNRSWFWSKQMYGKMVRLLSVVYPEVLWERYDSKSLKPIPEIQLSLDLMIPTKAM